MARKKGRKKERGVRWREGGREGTRQRQTEKARGNQHNNYNNIMIQYSYSEKHYMHNHCNYINYKERHASMHAYKNRWRERGKKEGREEGRERVGK